MDGTLVDHSKYIPNSIKRRIQFKLSRTDKIETLVKLLEDMEMDFTFAPATKSEVNILQPYYIRIYGDSARKIFDYLSGVKSFPPSWCKLSKPDLLDVLHSIKDTDGTTPHNRTYWSSTDIHNINVIKAAGQRHHIEIREHKSDSRRSGFVLDGKQQFVVSFDMRRELP
jgi:hypothetical protein